MNNESHDYLFHYTNTSSLALILKNQNIKFNPLTVLDDSEEEKIKDHQQYSKYCFVSSWTDNETESIPMWNMYTNLSEGVRIKLPKYPFKEYLIDQSAYRKSFESDNYNISGQGFYTIISPEDFFDGNYFLPTNVQKNILNQVRYTNDIDDLYPQILSVLDGNTHLNMGSLGVCKNKYWSFQDEWRYILNFFPFGYKEMMEEAINNSNQKILRKIHEGVDLPFNYYFLKIDQIKFEQMHITLSPKISEGNRLITKLLVEKYNPKAVVKESELLNKLR